jgi:hypothetical protein
MPSFGKDEANRGVSEVQRISSYLFLMLPALSRYSSLIS